MQTLPCRCRNVWHLLVSSSYETTSSEESSGDEKPKIEVEEEDSSEPEVEKEKEMEPQPEEKPEEAAESRQKDEEVSAEGEGGAAAAEKEVERGLLDPEISQELLEEQAEGWDRQKSFTCSCVLGIAWNALLLADSGEHTRQAKEKKKRLRLIFSCSVMCISATNPLITINTYSITMSERIKTPTMYSYFCH